MKWMVTKCVPLFFSPVVLYSAYSFVLLIENCKIVKFIVFQNCVCILSLQPAKVSREIGQRCCRFLVIPLFARLFFGDVSFDDVITAFADERTIA